MNMLSAGSTRRLAGGVSVLAIAGFGATVLAQPAAATVGPTPVVVTEAAAPTAVTAASAVLHSSVNLPLVNHLQEGGVGIETPVVFHAVAKVQYSTDPALAADVVSLDPVPSVIAQNVGVVPVASTASGLTACTTYYYRAQAQVGSVAADSVPAPVTLGAIESFKTTGCPLPLTVKAKSASAALPRTGSTVVVKSAATSSAGKIRTVVKCLPVAAAGRGDITYCTVKLGRKGKVTVTTHGHRGVRVIVAQRAVPKAGSTAKASTIWKRSWLVK